MRARYSARPAFGLEEARSPRDLLHRLSDRSVLDEFRPHAANVRGVSASKGRTKLATRTQTLNAGDPAPDFSLRTHDGRQVTLSGLRGQPVVIAFFAFAFTNT